MSPHLTHETSSLSKRGSPAGTSTAGVATGEVIATALGVATPPPSVAGSAGLVGLRTTGGLPAVEAA